MALVLKNVNECGAWAALGKAGGGLEASLEAQHHSVPHGTPCREGSAVASPPPCLLMDVLRICSGSAVKVGRGCYSIAARLGNV